jgi:hypothetical protein
MPRVIAQPESSVGARVHGQLRDFQGRPIQGKAVKVALPGPCSWDGVIFPAQHTVHTDEQGEFEFFLPPESELVPLSGEGGASYFLSCEGIGSWYISVPPDVTDVLIGAPKKQPKDPKKHP